MARTTIDKVKDVIETDLTDANITAYINTASLFLDNNITVADINSDLLIEIETYVTAHLIAYTKERQTTEEEAGTAKAKYTGKFEMGLKATSYGQIAISFDPTGELAQIGKRAAWIEAVEEEHPSEIYRIP